MSEPRPFNAKTIEFPNERRHSIDQALAVARMMPEGEERDKLISAAAKAALCDVSQLWVERGESRDPNLCEGRTHLWVKDHATCGCGAITDEKTDVATVALSSLVRMLQSDGVYRDQWLPGDEAIFDSAVEFLIEKGVINSKNDDA